MSEPAESEYVPGQPGARFEPYVRLVRSLMPRTSCVAMFGPSGDLRWSTDTMTGPDLTNVVDDALLAARGNPDSAGQLRVIAGGQPVFVCALRDNEKQLLALLAVLMRPAENDKKSGDFSFAHSLLAPALECLRRELVAGATIGELTQIVGGLDKNLNLLLQHGGSDTQASDANELQQLLQQTIELLRACTGALLVPEKSLTVVRAPAGTTPDTQFLMRTHRRLLQLAQTQREPLILNETQSGTAPENFSYRVLVVLAALARRALDRHSRAHARAGRGRLHRARRAHRRDPRPQGDRRHRQQLRFLKRSVHARGVRAAPAGGARAAQQQELVRALHQRRPAAHDQREVRHARR